MKLRKISTNATELSIGDNTVLFSYSTPVAAHVPPEGYLRTDRTFSKTTSRHINTWLGGMVAKVVPHSRIEEFSR